jgi:hypothetical protein
MNTPFGFYLPLADVGDVLQGLAPIIFVILYGIAHLVGSFQQEKKKAPPRPRPAPPQEFGGVQRAGGAAGGNQPTLEETLRREVEEFLRRAQGQNPQQAKNQPQRPAQRAPQRTIQTPARGGRQSEQRPKPPVPPRRLVQARQPEPAAPLSRPLSEQQPQPSYAPAPLGAGVAQHVAEHLRGTQELAQHAQHLGAEVAQADERMQEHLRQKFVHPIGTLAPGTTSVERRLAGTPASRELRELLARPGGVRQLIIANEILRRPEERWES